MTWKIQCGSRRLAVCNKNKYIQYMKTEKNRTKAQLLSWVNDKTHDNTVFKNVDNGIELPLLMKVINQMPKPVVVTFPLLSEAEKAAELLPVWAEALDLNSDFILLPETMKGEKYIPESEALRAKVIHRALFDETSVFLGSVSGVFSQIPDPDEIISSSFELQIGDKISINSLLESLLEMDYDDELESSVPGEYSKRGGIVDIFSPASDYPARIEFFGDSIESIRLYSPETQRTFQEIREYSVIPRAALGENSNGPLFINSFRKKHPSLVMVFPERCREHISRFGDKKSIQEWDSVIGNNDLIKALLLEPAESGFSDEGTDCGCRRSTDLIHGNDIPDELDSAYSEWRKQLTLERINQWLDTGYSVTISGNLESSGDHIHAWCDENQIKSSKIQIDDLYVPFGITITSQKQVILTEKELFTSTKHHHTLVAPVPEKNLKNIIDQAPGEESQFSDLEQNDYAVHLDHGICRYHGITEISHAKNIQEVFKLEFADEVIVYLPLFQANLLSKYVGSKRDLPKLNKKGGKRWLNSKIEASRDIRNMAIELLNVQAMRMKNKGHSFRQDDLWQHIFEEAFPFQETPDQLKSTAEIKVDMSSKKPMDRLLCGDVGFGKTEVAMRAAFKAVMDGKQVAVMVPTTILAQQHYYTFRDRFVEHPIIIEMLSRFKTPAQQRATLKQLKEGKVDILIGTHRVVQKDVNFSNLGLLIIDEEQRFGVGHKEKLKQFRATVDVLTMTATPIPRTLYMSMTGLRDLSTIMTPPNARLPVRTYVCKEDNKIAIEAIREEIQRGGQVYYLHNRVKTIRQKCSELQSLLPDVKFAVGHGRMEEKELESVMGDFLDGNTDVLVCTTIIESGLDIPNANTIIIERADRFGLSDLYQLKGRVGRWHRQAFAYMFLPRDQILTGNARKRISAIRRYSELGAGFRLALRDLEIRGAGNLLGALQSGHINTIGFELYCQLLRVAVNEQQGKTDPESRFIASAVNMDIDFVVYSSEQVKDKLVASLPESYIPSESQRLSFYKRLGNINKAKEIKTITEELKDRYGDIPDLVENFLALSKIRLLMAKSGYQSLQVKNKKVSITTKFSFYKINGKVPKLSNETPKKQLKELIKIVKSIK